MPLTTAQLNAIKNQRIEVKDSAQGTEITIVTRTLSGTLGDYYNRGKKYTESTVAVNATGGFNTGYVFNQSLGGLIESSGVTFELSDDYLTSLRAEHTLIRWNGVDYSIDSVNNTPETGEVIISCSKIK